MAAKMPNLSAPHIPDAELAGLVQGSHQQLAVRLSDALQQETKRFGGKPARLLASFDAHVLAMSESGEVFRVEYEQAVNGDLHFTRQTPVDVTVVTEQSLRRFVRSEAFAAVDLYMRGLSKQADLKLAEMLPFVDASMVRSDVENLAAFVESRKQTPAWKGLLENRQTQVMSYLAEEQLPTPLAPKFKKLYDGATSRTELPTFQPLVQADMKALVTRLVTVESQAAQALDQIRSVKGAAGNSEAATLTQLETYAADLLNDVRQVKEFAEDASQDVKSVDLLAKVFDSMASEVASFEVAGAFAAKMASRLAEASR